MAQRFREHPDAVAENARLAELLTFDLTEDLGYRYPGSEDPTPTASWPSCAALASRRYPRGGDAAARLEEELRVIRHLRLSGFFLLHRDMLEGWRARWRSRCAVPSPPGGCCRPGARRGSSVSSIVCYLTGLSHIDPIQNEALPGGASSTRS